MTVTLDEVKDFVNKEAERRNGKIIRKLPRVMHEMTTKPHWYVFNLGPWVWDRQLGGKGTRVLSACVEGQEYSDPLSFPVLDNETVATDMNKMDNVQEEGFLTVQAFMREGYGFKPEDSLRMWGVGVIDHWPPKEKDLSDPRKKFNAKLDELIGEADRFYENREYQNITDRHRWAARQRKQAKGWLNENPESVNCPACGSVVMQNIAVCPHCSATLNAELAKTYFPERFK